MRHHYVPQFLLSPWAVNNSDGKLEIFRLDLKSIPSSRRTPKHTGFDNDLYALTKDYVAGMEKQAIEKQFLMRVDNKGSIVREKLNNNGLNALTAEDREDWARFIMSLRIRQPDIVQELRESSTEHLKTSLESDPLEYESISAEDDPSSLEGWTEKEFPGLIDNFGLSFFHKLVDNPKYGIMILKMKWWVIDFENVPYELLLSDHPCIFTNGIEDPNLIIALPISPEKVFLATKGEDVSKNILNKKPKELLTLINKSICSQARVRIYAANEKPRRFIENHIKM